MRRNKRSAPPRNGFSFKEPKLEEPDEEYNNFANNSSSQSMLDRIPKEEPGVPTAQISTIPFPDKVPKAEPVEEPQFSLDKVIKEEPSDDFPPLPLLEQVVKPEPIDEEPLLKIPKEEEPTSSTQATAPPVPMWRPNFKYMDNDCYDDFDLETEMSLGTSLLFDRKSDPPESKKKKEKKSKKIKEEVEEEEVDAYSLLDDDHEDDVDNEPVIPEKKLLHPSKIKEALDKNFALNPHPSAKEMQFIAEDISVRYRTVFEHYEEKRLKNRVKCAENDHCNKIKIFMERESEQLCYMKIADDLRVILEEELQILISSKKRFSLGYVHAIMERTDLPPAYIRGQYESWKRRLSSVDREDYLISDWKRDSEEQNNLIPIDVLRQLEEAYLFKKYNSEEKEWSPKEIRALSTELGLSEARIQKWLEKREGAIDNIKTDLADIRRDLDVRPSTRKLNKKIVQGLIREYNKNCRPSFDARVAMAQLHGLNEMQVRNFFNKRRINERKSSVWEKARKEYLGLSAIKKEMMERAAQEKRKSAADNAATAKSIGVSYRTLCSFIDWRKSVISAKQIFKN